MPDGELSPEQQINTEVTVGQSLHALGAAFGANVDARLGGGTPNGSWVFTDLNELDQVIHQWTDIQSTLTHRVFAIERTTFAAIPPATDMMSEIQVDALKKSLTAMRQHAIDMAVYAETYVAKLREARSAYAVTEQNNATLFDGHHG
ncbi:hypothetical protein ACFQ1S_03330 [Kibdelosporangium lantanae]|uniref:PE domain-containing protein n=1 Tax=Kibdelosporangium lantanae TaxID=1497396 RepID=A0ABW3M473_9PSEU